MAEAPATYRQFWAHYLRAHADPRTRAVHYLGSGLALAAVIAAAASGDLRWLVAAPLAGYGCAWFAHFTLERNRPASFGHPLWSLLSDYRMLALFVCGRLGPHLAQAGVTVRPRRA